MFIQKIIKYSIISLIFFSASSVFADNFDLTPTVYNSESAIDFVIVGDGFTAAEQALFQAKSTEIRNHLLTSLPYNSEQDKFNFYDMEVHSNESGISVEGGTQVDNFFGSYRNKEGLYHYTGYSEDQRVILRNYLKKKFRKRVYVIMVVNDPEYGGSGEFISDKLLSIVQSTYDTQYNVFRELVLHEIGHSFGDLADEYGGNCTNTDRPDDWDPERYDKKNVTRDNVNDRKWDYLASPQYILGANYCDNEWYRSSPAGLMRSTASGNEHNELGQILIKERIAEDVAYNENVVAIIDESRFDGGDLPTKNVRIHFDTVTLTKDLICKELYIAADSTLIVQPNVSIDCDTIIKLGEIQYQKQKKKSLIRYGCKNKKASNYQRFSRHNPRLCVFEKPLLTQLN